MWNIGSLSFERLHAPVARGRARLREVKFSFAHQKRTRKVPATFEAREARIKGCSPLIIPKKLSKRKKASRFAKRFFLVSPIYGFAEDFMFTQGEN